ncbi:hypothetical protein Unana1_06919 [Umbelopsis nana]
MLQGLHLPGNGIMQTVSAKLECCREKHRYQSHLKNWAYRILNHCKELIQQLHELGAFSIVDEQISLMLTLPMLFLDLGTGTLYLSRNGQEQLIAVMIVAAYNRTEDQIIQLLQPEESISPLADVLPWQRSTERFRQSVAVNGPAAYESIAEVIAVVDQYMVFELATELVPVPTNDDLPVCVLDVDSLSLVPLTILGSIPYVALSHVWRQKLFTLEIRDGAKSINQGAIDLFRTVANEAETKYIWVDTVCIPSDEDAR